jgi:hypothetical protein
VIRILIFVFCCAPVARAAWEARVIADDLKDGYQVVIADVNHDGKPDLIAVASGQTDLVWYENPTWKRHVISSGLHHMINVAALDTDGDGIPEIALAYEFSNDARKSLGIVALLHHDGDPTRPWTLREIDRLPTSHRLRWAKLNGKDILLNAPLTAATAVPPSYEGHVPLVFYRPGEWKREVIDTANEGVQHGIYPSPHGLSDHILTASFSGIDHYQFEAGKWNRREISHGDLSPCPKCGSSDVAVGHQNGAEMIVAIEPWHGNQVVAYFESHHKWVRNIIDEGLTDGHTILVANGMVIAGFRGHGGGVRAYQQAKDGKWRKSVVEDGTPAASCAAGKAEIFCIGGTKITAYTMR